MSNHKKTYEVPLYAYVHFDNTWTYSDYIEIEDQKEPQVIKKMQVAIGRDEKDKPIIQFLLIYDNEKANILEHPKYENNIIDGKTDIVGFIYSTKHE